MKLYYSKNLNPRVAVAVARYLNSPVQFVAATPQDPAHKEAFKALNPNALVPVLEENGKTLWETDAIVCRLSALAKSDFWRTGADEPEMLQWVSWATHHLNKAAGDVYFFRVIWPTFAKDAAPQDPINKGLRDFRRHAPVLEAALAGKTWLVGNKLSYADFRAASALPFAQSAGLPLPEFPNMARWHAQLMDLPSWRTPFEGLGRA